MTHLLALHLEFKHGSKLGIAGPGDTIRLVHRLRGLLALKANRYDSVLLLTTSEVAQFRGFLDPVAPSATVEESELREGSFIARHVPGDSDYPETSGRIDDEALSDWIGRGLEQNDNVHPWVVHAYIGCGSKVAQLRLNARSLRERIDLDYGPSGMGWSRWQTPGDAQPLEGAVPDRPVVAAHVRNLASAELNSPSWFTQIVREVASEMKYGLLWYGARTEDDFSWRQPGEAVLPYVGATLAEQTVSLRQQASCAVGFNSGGLDIASAAGLPVLRAGEFQAGGCLLEPEQRARNWGRRYNSFLAVRTNIGLRPAWLPPERFDPAIFRESLKAFLQLHSAGSLAFPHHLVLPWNEPLSASRFSEQANTYTVSPGVG